MKNTQVKEGRFLETLQIDIKINQTATKNEPNKAKGLVNSQNPFAEILAMFQPIVQSNSGNEAEKSDGQSEVELQPGDSSDWKEDENLPLLALLLDFKKMIEQPQGEKGNSVLSETTSLNKSSEINDKSPLADQLRKFVQELVSVKDSGVFSKPLANLNEYIEEAVKIVQAYAEDNSLKGQGKIEQETIHQLEKLISEFQNKRDSSESNRPMNLDKNQVVLSKASPIDHPIYKGIKEPAESKVEFDAKLLSAPGLPKTQIAVPLQGEMAGNPPVQRLNVEEFIREASGWMGRFSIHAKGQGSGEARFLLNPENLGKVEVKIAFQDGKLTAQFVTDTLSAKEALQAQIPVLKQALQHQGLIVAKLDIVQQSQLPNYSDTAGSAFSQGGFSSSQDQQAFRPSGQGTGRQNKSKTEEIDVEQVPFTYGTTPQTLGPRIDFTV
ncbi:flagellar hook-length control protein [Bacillus sp. B-jedd]|nr:flagellar hook-length control protein [Bacillus sp. B-jedd]